MYGQSKRLVIGRGTFLKQGETSKLLVTMWAGMTDWKSPNAIIILLGKQFSPTGIVLSKQLWEWSWKVDVDLAILCKCSG